MRFHLLACLLLTLACPGYSRADTKELRLRIASGPADLDWSTAASPLASFVFGNIMAGLTELDDRLVARPALAQSIELSADGTVYTFHLRPDVKWSDRKPLTAADFLASWKVLLDPGNLKPFAVMLGNVVGAADYNHGKSKEFSEVGVRALDASTLQVTLVQPQAYFLQLLANAATFPMRQDLLTRHGHGWHEPGKTAVLGPFIPVSYERGRLLLLKRNPAYYGPAPQLDLVTLALVADDAKAVELFRQRKLDVVLHLKKIDAAASEKTATPQAARQFRTRFLLFNCQSYPYSLSPVRRAVALSIDRSKLAYLARQGFARADTLVPPEFFPEGAEIKTEFDPKAARAALEESGLVAEKMAPLELVALAGEDHALAANELAAQIRKTLGIRVNVKLQSREQFNQRVATRSSSLYYLALDATYADLDSFLSGFTSNSGLNAMQWHNRRYDELIAKAAVTADADARKALYREALALLLVKDYALVPLHFEHFNYLAATRVKGFAISPLGTVKLREVKLEP